MADKADLDEVMSYLRDHPGVARSEVMRALRVSARLVAQAEARLDDQAFDRRRSRRRLAVALGSVGIALGAGWLLWPRPDQEPIAPPRSREVLAAERGLYAALDQKNPARIAEASAHLASPDEGLRLAATRYLLGVGAREERLLAMVDDPSERVRRAVIQLLGSGPELPGLSERVLVLVSDQERDAAERLLGLDLLERRGLLERGSGELERILPLVADAQVGVRERAERLLEHTLGRRPKTAALDPAERLRSWRALLAETP